VSDDDQAIELDHLEWHVDDDGTEYFHHAGHRYELGEDGYAYDVGAIAPSPDDEAAEPAPAEGTETTELPAATADETVRISSGGDGDGRSKMAAAVEPPAGVRLDQTPSGNGRSEPTDVMLKVRGLHSGYGNLPVLHGVDFDIERGSTAVLLGLNGAGKTTTATNICGALGVWKGSIELDGQDIAGWGIKKSVDAGVVMVPEGRRVFPDLSVERNLQIGSWQQRKDTDWVAEQRERVLGYFPRLRERLAQKAGTLSGGEQQMLAIARGLMAKPRLLIIDEASMGLAPVIVSQVFEIIEQINEDGVTVLMIEQNVGALDVADMAIVMEQGTIIRELHGEELADRALVSQTLMG
jgi:branched-chain amino acid transport system ATP-binding protein